MSHDPKTARGFESFVSFFSGLAPVDEVDAIERYERYISDYFTKAIADVRKTAASELRRILLLEIQDANERIEAGKSNPLYWLHRRFQQLADEIEDGEYSPDDEEPDEALTTNGQGVSEKQYQMTFVATGKFVNLIDEETFEREYDGDILRLCRYLYDVEGMGLFDELKLVDAEVL